MKQQKLYTFLLTIFILGLVGAVFYRMWTPYSPAQVDDIWVINLDRDGERWKNIQRATSRYADKVHRFSAMDGKSIVDRESIHNEGVGYNFTLVRGKMDEVVNKGVVGCWLSHKRLLTQLAAEDRQNDYGHLVLEDDVAIPDDFLSGADTWSRIAANVPGDWDMVYLGLAGNVSGIPIADNIIKLRPYQKDQYGTHAYLVKHGSLKTKILPALRFMTDAIDEQYNTLFGDLNAYCIRPSIIELHSELSKTSSINKLQ